MQSQQDATKIMQLKCNASQSASLLYLK